MHLAVELVLTVLLCSPGAQAQPPAPMRILPKVVLRNPAGAAERLLTVPVFRVTPGRSYQVEVSFGGDPSELEAPGKLRRLRIFQRVGPANCEKVDCWPTVATIYSRYGALQIRGFEASSDEILVALWYVLADSKDQAGEESVVGEVTMGRDEVEVHLPSPYGDTVFRMTVR